MAPKTNAGSKSAADNMTPEQLERALYVPPPPDPQQLEEHVRQLLMRAQVSWLPKRDILDILTNWREYSLPISLMPPDQPGPGSLFLFDRNQLKSFRRDNHVWKSKAGGKTVQETHEKLKIEGGIPALNCYYAHSADGTLQRRCYWKLAGNPNIVLMHYRAPGNIKGRATNAATPLHLQDRDAVSIPNSLAPAHVTTNVPNQLANLVPAVDAGQRGVHSTTSVTHASMKKESQDGDAATATAQYHVHPNSLVPAPNGAAPSQLEPHANLQSGTVPAPMVVPAPPPNAQLPAEHAWGGWYPETMHQALPQQDGGNNQSVHLVSHPHAGPDQHAPDQVAGPPPLQAKDVGIDRGNVNDAAADTYGLAYATAANLSTANEGPAGTTRIVAQPDASNSSQAHGSGTEALAAGAPDDIEPPHKRQRPGDDEGPLL
eukprot:jgi/Ulvmu1/4426/UM002_0151.1